MDNNTIFENDLDAQLETLTTDDISLDELLAEVNALTGDTPIAEIPVSDATVTDIPLSDFPVTPTLPPRRRDRKSEREQKILKHTRLFYRIYFISIAVLLCALLILMIPLRNWLKQFESTQPDQYSQHIYDTYFAQPDWGKIYDTAQIGDTEFEDRDDFVRYMQSKISASPDKQLSYYQTSTGLSKDHKYIVQLGNEKIATFTLNGNVNSSTKMTDWTMSSLQLSIARDQSVSIQRLPGQTVLINGKEVSDNYIVRNIYTKAEEYLPEGVHGHQLQELYIDGLMVTPNVQVLDASGNTVPTVFNAETNSYTLDVPVAVMTDAERDIVLGAAKANALFAIRAIGTGELSKHFDSATQIYKDLCSTPTFIQSFASYAFDESVTTVSDFYRYSDDLFSARVTLQLDITRKNGTVKSLEMNTTYIFTKNDSGAFKVTNITNVNLQEQLEQIRLTFDCDGTVLDSMLVDTTATTITPPLPTVPEGQEFLGWANREVDSNGQITMNILFVPNETGTAQVLTDLKEPMTLYAVFGEEGAVRNG